MRLALLLAAALSPPWLPAAAAERDFPSYDLDRTCRDQADYAFSATLGQVDLPREIAICTARERASRDLAAVAWARMSPGARAECATLAEGRYTRLDACLSEDRARRSAR